jgi:hypothetical protein
MCTYELWCDALNDVGTDVPVLVASIVMVVESTQLLIPEVLNLHYYHFAVLVASIVMVVESIRLLIPEVLNLHYYYFEKPKTRTFFSKIYADINNRVRFSIHLP